MSNTKSEESPNYYHLRIAPDKLSVNYDFRRFSESVSATGKGLWDRDHQNKIKEGDYLGFIVGTKNEEQIHIYQVDRICTADERPSHWASSTPYTQGNGTKKVSHRQAIVLTNNHSIKTYDWRDFRRITGLGKNCPSWMPRGTQIVLNKEKLPFILPPPDEVIPASAASTVEGLAQRLASLRSALEDLDALKDSGVFSTEEVDEVRAGLIAEFGFGS
jgi:hypothetical protein